MALGQGEGSLGLFHGDAGIGVVDGGQDITGLDVLGFDDIDLGDRPGDQGVDLGDIGADIGVIGRDEVRGVEAVIGAPADGANHDGDGDIGEELLALVVGGSGGLGTDGGAVGGRSGGIGHGGFSAFVSVIRFEWLRRRCCIGRRGP